MPSKNRPRSSCSTGTDFRGQTNAATISIETTYVAASITITLGALSSAISTPAVAGPSRIRPGDLVIRTSVVSPGECVVLRTKHGEDAQVNRPEVTEIVTRARTAS